MSRFFPDNHDCPEFLGIREFFKCPSFVVILRQTFVIILEPTFILTGEVRPHRSHGFVQGTSGCGQGTSGFGQGTSGLASFECNFSLFFIWLSLEIDGVGKTAPLRKVSKFKYEGVAGGMCAGTGLIARMC